MKTITKQAAKDALKFATDVELAAFLRITPQSLTRIKPNDKMPDTQAWKLRALRPRLFPIPKNERR